jgi:alpha-ketoglutarate-dependent taurine dioxygenase
VVVADNLRVAHKATVVTAAVRRVLDRTTVAAGTAFKAYQAAHPAPQEQAALV